MDTFKKSLVSSSCAICSCWFLCFSVAPMAAQCTPCVSPHAPSYVSKPQISRDELVSTLRFHLQVLESGMSPADVLKELIARLRSMGQTTPFYYEAIASSVSSSSSSSCSRANTHSSRAHSTAATHHGSHSNQRIDVSSGGHMHPVGSAPSGAGMSARCSRSSSSTSGAVGGIRVKSEPLADVEIVSTKTGERLLVTLFHFVS